MTTLNLPQSKNLSMRYWCVLGPRADIQYFDEEPSPAPLNVATIVSGVTTPISDVRGVKTGIPLLGSNPQVAFVGETFDMRNFDSHIQVSDWGDGGAVGDGYTHTYTSPASYWVKVNNAAGNCVAARFVRIIYRDRPVGNADPLQWSYPLKIEGVQGSVDSDFTFKVTLLLDTASLPSSSIGILPERTLIGVFGQQYIGGTPYGSITPIACGFASEPHMHMGSEGRTITFDCYGVCTILSMQDMLDLSFIDPGAIGICGIAVNSFQTVNGRSPLFQNIGDGNGAFVSNHWIKCSPPIAALHILQHVRVNFPSYSTLAMPASPVMQSTRVGLTNTYGTLGQFMNIECPSDIVEDDATAAYHAFDVPTGKVLTNLRNILVNEGFYMFGRHGGNIRIARKPYYQTTLDAPLLDITFADSQRLIKEDDIFLGDPRIVKQVRVSRPALMPLAKSTYNTVTNDAFGNPIIFPRYPVATIQNAANPNYNSLNASMLASAKSAGTDGLIATTQDPMVFNPLANFVVYPAVSMSGSAPGVTIEAQAVFCSDINAYAVGRYNEEKCRRRLLLHLGQLPGFGLGDILTISYVNSQLNINWSSKNFYVTRMSPDLSLNGYSKYDLVVEVMECLFSE